jgi:threonine dehydrogenase-like Zn-dependent dehydrogenase
MGSGRFRTFSDGLGIDVENTAQAAHFGTYASMVLSHRTDAYRSLSEDAAGRDVHASKPFQSVPWRIGLKTLKSGAPIDIGMSIRSVAVVGAGYVGLPVACMFASRGIATLAVDIDIARVDKINRGTSPIEGEEPGLTELISSAVKGGLLTATTDYGSISGADAIIVCVDTPIDEATRTPVLNVLRSAACSVGEHMKRGVLVSIESTLPPRTMQDVVTPILEQASGMKVGKDFLLVHCRSG